MREQAKHTIYRLVPVVMLVVTGARALGCQKPGEVEARRRDGQRRCTGR